MSSANPFCQMIRPIHQARMGKFGTSTPLDSDFRWVSFPRAKRVLDSLDPGLPIGVDSRARRPCRLASVRPLYAIIFHYTILIVLIVMILSLLSLLLWCYHYIIIIILFFLLLSLLIITIIVIVVIVNVIVIIIIIIIIIIIKIIVLLLLLIIIIMHSLARASGSAPPAWTPTRSRTRRPAPPPSVRQRHLWKTPRTTLSSGKHKGHLSERLPLRLPDVVSAQPLHSLSIAPFSLSTMASSLFLSLSLLSPLCCPLSAVLLIWLPELVIF